MEPPGVWRVLLVGPSVGELGAELTSSFDLANDPLPELWGGGSILSDNLKKKAVLFIEPFIWLIKFTQFEVSINGYLPIVVYFIHFYDASRIKYEYCSAYIIRQF